MIWTGRLRLRATMLRARLGSVPRRVRRMLGLRPRTPRARILWNLKRGDWRVCPSGLSPEGFGVDQQDDEIALPAASRPEEVVAALRLALGGCRFLDSRAEQMSGHKWKELIDNHLMVSVFERGGKLHLGGWQRVVRRAGDYYQPLEGVAGTIAADAAPQAIFTLLRGLLDRVREREGEGYGR
jgi:hypothetical protein